MAASEDPLSLIERLKQQYGVDEPSALYGPSVVVPNSAFRREWTHLLESAGFKIYLGDQYGRVTWIIPLKGRPNKPGSNPGRGCITGRPWTQEEDDLILELLGRGKGPTEIARDLSGKMDRTEIAIKKRALKLKRQGSGEIQPTPALEKPAENPGEPTAQPASVQAHPEIRSLLEAALLLTEDPRHQPALRILLEACLRKVQPEIQDQEASH